MRNDQIAAMFHEMADLLSIEGGDPYRARAFGRIGRAVEKLALPVATMLRSGALRSVPGIGAGGVHRIKEILRTGQCADHRRLTARMPAGIRDLMKVRGIGPRTLRVIYSHLRIGSVDELETAARRGLLATLPRIGQQTQESILVAIERYRRRREKLPLVAALREAERVIEPLRAVHGVQRAAVAGSLRRRKEQTKDFDVLVASDEPELIVRSFVHLAPVAEVLVAGEGRASVMLDCGLQADLRVLPLESFGAGLHYFTGSKDHNIAIRIRGHRHGFKISDYGVHRDADEVLLDPCPEEERVFSAVGLPWIPPELREGTGEIQAAEQGRLPQLIEEAQLAGELHMHTTDSDGTASAEVMVRHAIELGHRYVAVTDHDYMVGDLAAQGRRLTELQARFPQIRILRGVEVDIRADGTLARPLEELAALDWVVASVHGSFELPAAVQTQRVIAAIESGVVDMIAHPTGRRFSGRDPVAIDLPQVMAACARRGVALEINGAPDRLDLDASQAKHAKLAGVPLVLGSDAHGPAELHNRRHAVWVARRAWVEAADVLNAQPVEVLLRRRAERLQRGSASALVTRVPQPLPQPPPVHRAVRPGKDTGWRPELPTAPPSGRLPRGAHSAEVDLPPRAAPSLPAWPQAAPAPAQPTAASAPAEPAAVVPVPEPDPPVVPEPEPEAPARGATLAARLQAQPLDAELHGRLARLLEGHEDEPLVAALGADAFQRAFALLLSAPASEPSDEAATPLDELPLPPALRRRLLGAGYTTRGQLLAAPDASLLALPGVGPGALRRIRAL